MQKDRETAVREAYVQSAHVQVRYLRRSLQELWEKAHRQTAWGRQVAL